MPLEGAVGVRACVGLEIPGNVDQVPSDSLLPSLGFIADLHVLEATPTTVSVTREWALDFWPLAVADGSPKRSLVHG